ncbi:PAS-domain containing protein [Novispirillum itersonii]|uniref:PAS-domain containing protein n=1 Tax=Novispirillum itersonii TaxID=189 RepID=UPI00036C8EEE|nr:PAS-domain containing protein [Novispirillum itersonii]
MTRLDLVLDTVEQGVVTVDAGLRLTFCNLRWRQMMGLPEALTRPGTPWEDILRFRAAQIEAEATGLSEAEREGLVRTLMDKTLRSHERRHRYELRLENGLVLQVEGNPLPDGGFVRTFSDITALRRKEQELERTRERYALALRSSNEGIYDWDIDTGTLFFSERVREVFGLPPGTLRPEDWSSRILPEDVAVYRRAHIDHLRGHTERFSCEYRMQLGSGGVVWVRQHGLALRDGSGRAIRLTGSVADITESRLVTERLRESEERYAQAVIALNEGVYDWDVPAGTVIASPRLSELFDIGADDGGLYAAMEWLDRIHPDDRHRFRSAVRDLLRGMRPRLSLEYRFREQASSLAAPGLQSYRWVLQRGTAVRDPHTGQVRRIIGSAGDITERKTAEAALLRSQEDLARERELLKAVVENMDQGLFMADSDQRLVAHNARFREMFGLPETLFTGRPALSRLLRHMFDRGDLGPDFDAACEEYLGEAACRSHDMTEIRRRDGRIYESRNVPLADGSFVRTFTDVTDQRKAEEQVRDLIEAMPLPMVVSGLKSQKYLFANEYAREVFGIDPADPAQAERSVTEIYVNPADRQRLVSRLGDDGAIKDFEVELKTADGRRMWALLSASLMTYRGQAAILVASNDISERKRLEGDLERARDEAEAALRTLKSTQKSLIEAEKMASLGGLVAGVAHEINTPVGIVVTTTTHLQEKVKAIRTLFDEGRIRKQDFADFLGVADNATTLLLSNSLRAANLIQSFKQVAVDQTCEERRQFDLRAYVQEVLVSLGPKLKRTPYVVTLDCPEGILMDSYPGPFAQVLTNLVVNSLQHGFDGRDSGQIHMIARREPGSGSVVLTYRDDGVGIPAANLTRIFDPFFTTKRGQGGSGLGMNIVYNIVVQSLKGTITVDSEPGKGVCFTLCLPCRVPAQPAAAAQ